MREIKFRAWDGERLKPVTLWGFHEGFIMTNKGSADEEEFKVMQYTGLKVNGEQQLFEGDIVPVKVSIHKGWKQGWIHVNRNAVVEYVEDEMRFMFVAVVEGYGRQYVPFDKSIRQSYKIIGNIYENPELLEVAQ